jgi:hypothetical protein
VGNLLRALWRSVVRNVEVLGSEVDSGGYDLVLECNDIAGYVQLKSSHCDARTSRVKAYRA